MVSRKNKIFRRFFSPGSESGHLFLSIFRSPKIELPQIYAFFIGTLFGLIDLLIFELKEIYYEFYGCGKRNNHFSLLDQ